MNKEIPEEERSTCRSISIEKEFVTHYTSDSEGRTRTEFKEVEKKVYGIFESDYVNEELIAIYADEEEAQKELRRIDKAWCYIEEIEVK